METTVFVTRGFGNMYHYLCPSSSFMFLKYIHPSSTCCRLSIPTSSFQLTSITSKLRSQSCQSASVHPIPLPHRRIRKHERSHSTTPSQDAVSKPCSRVSLDMSIHDGRNTTRDEPFTNHVAAAKVRLSSSPCPRILSLRHRSGRSRHRTLRATIIPRQNHPLRPSNTIPLPPNLKRIPLLPQRQPRHQHQPHPFTSASSIKCTRRYLHPRPRSPHAARARPGVRAPVHASKCSSLDKTRSTLRVRSQRRNRRARRNHQRKARVCKCARSVLTRARGESRIS
jgi:hypothetical protein